MDVLLSRDLDSRVSAREVAAVREWLGSGRAVHSMRDHPTHWVPMLGSAWAARLDTPGARARWAETWRTILGGQDSLATSLVYADRWDTAATGGSALCHGGARYVRCCREDYGMDQTLLELYVWHHWASRDALLHDSYRSHQSLQ